MPSDISRVACLFHMNCKTLFGLRGNSVTGRATKLLKQTLGRPSDIYQKFSSVETNRWRVQINALKSVAASYNAGLRISCHKCDVFGDFSLHRTFINYYD